MSPGALIRQTLLNVPPGPNVRRPSIDTKLLAKTLAELGKIGSNINQIAYRYNVSDGCPATTSRAPSMPPCANCWNGAHALMQSLGYDRNRRPPEK